MVAAILVRIHGSALQLFQSLTRFQGHKFRQSVHPGAFGPDLAKKLSSLVKMEKNVMRSMELVGRERMEVAVSLTLCDMIDRILMS